ncbi:MAG TPA: glycosyltransferase family 87 protein [Allosphingosinicella sp.]|nr:glycosyltransferase family 87 protein [Allosphingosinicella sp.]
MISEAPPRPVGSAAPQASLWRVAWIFVIFCALMLFARDLMATRFGGDGSIADVALWGRDFVNVYTSGALTHAGRLDILYDVPAYQAYQLQLFDAALVSHNYSYPPVTLFYTWAFALLPYWAALILWLAGTGALFWWAARPYLREVRLPGWVALAAPACLVNLWAGHYGFLIGALWLGAWTLLPRRPVLAGMLIGCLVVKPHLAILVPLVLLVRRDWVAFGAAAATSIGLVLLSVLLFGPEIWLTYLGDTALRQAEMVDDVGAFFLTMMPTVAPALSSLGASTVLALLVQGAVALWAVTLLVRHLPKDSRAAGLATATATFLVLPYAFAYDMTVVGLAGLLLFRRAVMAPPGPYHVLYALAAVLPMALIYFNLVHLPLAPLLLAFQLLALTGRVPDRREDAQQGAAVPG